MARLAIFVAAALVASFPAAAFAGDHKGGPEKQEMKLFCHAANLTADQKTQVHALMKSCHEQSKPLKEQMHTLRGQIAEKLASAGPVSAADLAPLQQQVAQLREQLCQQHIQTVLQVRALLTPDQLAKVSAAYQKMATLQTEMSSLTAPSEDLSPVPNGAIGGKADTDELPTE